MNANQIIPIGAAGVSGLLIGSGLGYATARKRSNKKNRGAKVVKIGIGKASIYISGKDTRTRLAKGKTAAIEELDSQRGGSLILF
jgi:hypothetical protein